MTDQAEQLDVLQVVELLGVTLARDAGLAATITEYWLNEPAYEHVIELITRKNPTMGQKCRTRGASIVFAVMGHNVIVRLDK